jgi:hypothetical protein
MGLADRIYEDATEPYFRRRQIKQGHIGTGVPLGITRAPLHQRIVGLFGGPVGALINASR